MLYDLLEILFRAAVCVATVVALTRLNGLRSFSKMSSYDFAVTVACGSVIASSIISPKENLLLGVGALVALFVVQSLISFVRTASPKVRKSIENDPVLVMENGEILHQNLRDTRMTEADLFGKLREANAFDLRRVHAVILEPTGDVSVLHGSGDEDEEVSARVLEGVRR